VSVYHICADWSNHCRDIAVFRFSRLRPSATLDLLYACLDHPRCIVGGLYRCAKFGWNRHYSFEDTRFSMLWEFGLKMHTCFGGVFWVKMGKGKLFAVLSIWECINMGLMSYESNRVKICRGITIFRFSR